MKASELVTELQNLIAIHGDKDVAIDDGLTLRPVDEVDVSADEAEDCIILWWE